MPSFDPFTCNKKNPLLVQPFDLIECLFGQIIAEISFWKQVHMELFQTLRTNLSLRTGLPLSIIAGTSFNETIF